MAPTPGTGRPGLRERKQRRTRQAITDAALELFGRHGFDAVTIADIVERAEVGRSTYFRYFADKQDVLFGDDAELVEVLTGAARRFPATAAPGGGPPGGLPAAMTVARHAMLALVGHIGERYGARLAVRDGIIRGHEALTARSLLKQRRYADDLAAVLVGRGFPHEISALAAHVAVACYSAAHDAGGSPEDLMSGTRRAFAALQIVVPDDESAGAGEPVS